MHSDKIATPTTPVNFILRHPWLLPLVAALIVHVYSLFCGFVYDDVPLITGNSQLAEPGYIFKLWTRDYGLDFAGDVKGLYRPVFMLLTFIIHSVAGASPFAFHLVSLLFFLLAVFLVTRLTLTISRSAVAAIAAGTLYAVSPARVETVSLFMSLPDLIVEIGGLITVMLLMRSKSLLKSAVWCLITATVAGLTKESAFFIMPALAVAAILVSVIDWSSRKKLLLPASATLAGIFAALLIRTVAGIQSPPGTLTAIRELPYNGSVAALHSLLLTLRSYMLPAPTIFWREAPAGGSIYSFIAIIIVMLILAGIFFILLLKRQRTEVLLCAWLGASLVMIILSSAAGLAYSQRYLAVAPAIILLVCAVAAIAKQVYMQLPQNAAGKLIPTLFWLTVAIFIAANASFAIVAVAVCRTPISFFSAMHKANPTAVIPAGALAESLCDSGAPTADIEKLVRTITELDRSHVQVPLLHNLVIKRYLGGARFDEALAFCDWSLTIFPEDSDKMALQAVALAELKRYHEALDAIDNAIKLNPENQAYLTLRNQISANAK